MAEKPTGSEIEERFVFTNLEDAVRIAQQHIDEGMPWAPTQDKLNDAIDAFKAQGFVNKHYPLSLVPNGPGGES